MSTFAVTAVCGMGLERKNNEDNMSIDSVFIDEAAVKATEEKAFEYSGSFEDSLTASVCDGIGGENGGEYASQHAVRVLSTLPPGAGEQRIFAFLRRINSGIAAEAARLGYERIGSTAAILSVFGRTAVVVNVGDSRVYRLRGRKLEQLSHDQSEVQSYVDAGLLSEKKARSHPRRHMILQYLGMPDEQLQFERANISEFMTGDVFLLCSDGLTECLEDRKICSMLRSGADARQLYDEAMMQGGVDNTTIIIVRVE